MPPRKLTDTAKLERSATKIGEPIPKAIVDVNAASVGIPPQPDHDPRVELEALRKQLGVLRQQVTDAAQAAKRGTRQAAWQTEAAVKLYPVSALVVVAAFAGAFAFAVAALRTTPSRSRYDSALDEVRGLYDRARDRF
ncbi:hypothetical protein [Rhizobium tubonense]|uniref:DUF3618 domain-containing protein n=1 Tax=Rhizobium tubonense TaxID=484088 RepID=A0A2W4D0L3_9HYPH|nr:hypothetical protein [Rhizobium tubonense]PZM16488.1 hypothetical protein CPY51_04015 [Rhizobium tubonense]